MRLEEKDKISIEEYDRWRINALYEEFISARLRGYGDFPTIQGIDSTTFFDRMYELLEKVELKPGERSEILYIINRYKELIGVTLLTQRPKERERWVLVPLSGKRFGFKTLARSKYLEIKTLDEILRSEGPEGVIELERSFYFTLLMLPDRNREELIALSREALIEPAHANLVVVSLDIEDIDRLFVGEKPEEEIVQIALIGPEESIIAYMGFAPTSNVIGLIPKKLPYPEKKFTIYPHIQYINTGQLLYRKTR